MHFVRLGVTVSLVTACAQTEVERERLKKELKEEILAELAVEKQQGVPAGPLLEHEPYQGAKPVALPTGNITGRVLLRKRGLPGCRVRLMRLEGSGGPLGVYSAYRETALFETVTDDDGVYRFERVPVGAYRLKWLPVGETGWIRRLTDKPDVMVQEAHTANAGDFRAGRPLLDG